MNLKPQTSNLKQFNIKTILIIVIILAMAMGIFELSRYQNISKSASIKAEMPKTLKINQEVNIPVKINTANQNINAAEVYLKFNPTDLEVISLSKDKSFFTLWIKDQPAFSNEKGEISFAGGLPNPGFKGDGQIGTIKLKVKKKGDVKIEFDQRSRALLNNGSGTEIKLQLDPIKFKVGE